MQRKFLVSILLIVLIAISALLSFHVIYESSNVSDNTRELSVSTEGPYELDELIEDIENSSYYEGYDNETLIWMKSQGDKSVFFGDGTIVVMDKYNADKLHSEYATDVSITQYFRCNVLEKHTLTNNKEVLLVENVEYLSQNITSVVEV